MAEKDDALLREFKDLIYTIVKEVSEEVSTPVSIGVTKKIINDYIMEELRNMIASANDLIKIMPKTVEEIKRIKEEMQQSYEFVEKTSVQIDAHMKAIADEHQKTSAELNQALLLSRMKKNEKKELLNQLDKHLETQNRNLIMKMEQMEQRIVALQEKIEHQEDAIKMMSQYRREQ